MGYYIDVMIGIRTGGVFSGPTDIDDIKNRIKKIVKDIQDENYKPEQICLGFEEDRIDYCLSKELDGPKGSMVVLAGVFNGFEDAIIEFAKILSKEFVTEVMVTTWDEQTDESQHRIFLDGELLGNINENPISRTLRRVG